MSDKIINTFQQRRQVNEAVAALANASSEPELAQAVLRITQEYAPKLILPTLRKYLNTGSSQMRGGLGRLAAQLPHPETVALLRKETGRRDNPTQTRLTAALILEKFLQVEVSAGLMGDLRDPNIIVMQSLHEALEEGRANRHVLLEYVRQMRQESRDVAFLVLDLLGQLAEVDQPELLRLIAYDSRAEVAEAAITRLSALRDPAVAAQSAVALHALQSSLQPDLAQVAARQLRKLRLAGARWEPTPADDWWALITPCDFQGSQRLWFLRSGNGADGTLIGLRINRVGGILETFGSEMVDRQYLPPRRDEGELLSVSLAPGDSTVFLTIPYAYARHCLQQSLERHWRAPARALPEEFTLYNPFVFQHSAGAVSPQVSALLESGPDLWTQEESDLSRVTGKLLGHPAMAGWFLPVQNTQADQAGDAHNQRGQDRPPTGEHPLANLPMEALGRLARAIVAENVPQELAEQLRQALLAQAAWLHIAGHQSYARHAVYTAESLRHEPLHSHPLLLQMIALGISRLHERDITTKGPEVGR